MIPTRFFKLTDHRLVMVDFLRKLWHNFLLVWNGYWTVDRKCAPLLVHAGNSAFTSTHRCFWRGWVDRQQFRNLQLASLVTFLFGRFCIYWENLWRNYRLIGCQMERKQWRPKSGKEPPWLFVRERLSHLIGLMSKEKKLPVKAGECYWMIERSWWGY